MYFKRKIICWVIMVLSLGGFMGSIFTLNTINVFADKRMSVWRKTIADTEPTQLPEPTQMPEPTKPVKPEDEIKIFVGSEILEKDNRIDIQGIVYINGNVKGTVRCHSMEELYQTYNLNSSDNYKVLFEKIKADKCKSKLKKVFVKSKEADLDYDFDFIIKGNDINIKGIYITGKSLVLEYKGHKKKYISNRIQDSGAVTDEGEPYNGYIPVILPIATD
jgi:hypothetical protein